MDCWLKNMWFWVSSKIALIKFPESCSIYILRISREATKTNFKVTHISYFWKFLHIKWRHYKTQSMIHIKYVDNEPFICLVVSVWVSALLGRSAISGMGVIGPWNSRNIPQRGRQHAASPLPGRASQECRPGLHKADLLTRGPNSI